MRRNGLGATLGGRSVMNAAGGHRARSGSYMYQRAGGNAEYLAEEERRVRCVGYLLCAFLCAPRGPANAR
jgi:hypothetical protein